MLTRYEERITNLLPGGCNLSGEYREGNFMALLWEHRRTHVYGVTLCGDAEDEPAFSDESNSLTQLLRSLKHLESLKPKRLIVDWRLRVVESTPEAVILKKLSRLARHSCVQALVVSEGSNPVAATKLLDFCRLEESISTAIEWLRLSGAARSKGADKNFPQWAPIVAGIIGAMTFLFFLALSAVTFFHGALPETSRFPTEVVLAIGGAVSSALLGGHSVVNGPLPIPFVQNSTPMQISVAGGVATLVILLVLGRLLFG